VIAIIVLSADAADFIPKAEHERENIWEEFWE
jgi:hypothetical protein